LEFRGISDDSNWINQPSKLLVDPQLSVLKRVKEFVGFDQLIKLLVGPQVQVK